MKELLQYFDKTYVISMPARSDRRATLLSNLSLAGADERVVSAAVECVFPDARKGEHPARGCFASHAAVCAASLERGYDKILVLEDDAAVISGMPAGFIRQIQLFDWDLLYLGGNPGSDLEKIDVNLVRIKDTLCTHAIAYSRKAMEFVVAAFGRFGETFHPIDQVLKSAQANELLAIGVYPMMMTQSPGMSDIERSAIDYSFIAENYHRRATQASDNSKHQLVKVGFFVKAGADSISELRVTANSLSAQTYPNFELVAVSDREFFTDGVDTKTHVGTMESAMAKSDCHVCCEIANGATVHPGVCFTVVQDYRMTHDTEVSCSGLVFSYDKKPKSSAARIIPWVYEG